jgi:hypothetical protein
MEKNYEYYGMSELIEELEKRDRQQLRVLRLLKITEGVSEQLYAEVADIFDGAI